MILIDDEKPTIIHEVQTSLGKLAGVFANVRELLSLENNYEDDTEPQTDLGINLETTSSLPTSVTTPILEALIPGIPGVDYFPESHKPSKEQRQKINEGL